MSTKRTSSNSVEETTERSESVFQQEDNAKRVRLVSGSETTLQDLPIELLEDILIKAVVMEVKGMKLAKCVWKEKADLVMSRLQTVCSPWSNLLTTNYFRNKVYGILQLTAQESIRLELLPASFALGRVGLAMELATLRDEIFILWATNSPDIKVYDFNSMAAPKDAIPLPGRRNPLAMASCSISNCVYLMDRERGLQGSVYRITKDDGQHYNISEVISDVWLPSPTLSVSANGDLILSRQRGKDRALISIYNAAGYLDREMRLSAEISGIKQIIPKSNGNLVLRSLEKGEFKPILTEIDPRGTILRQYFHSVSVLGNVCCADKYGRMFIMEPVGIVPNKIVLLDSEFNILEFKSLSLEEDFMIYPYMLFYNSNRDEILCFFVRNDVCVFRFRED